MLSRFSSIFIAPIVGLAVGVLTAYGQGWLGDGFNSLANSAGPWSLAAFLVARRARGIPVAIIAAVITLVMSVIGYAIATEIRGGSNAASTVVFWVLAGFLAGPPLGVAAQWSKQKVVLRAVGYGVLGGVFLGEGIYGLDRIADTTEPNYWRVEILVGVAVIAFAAFTASRAARRTTVTPFVLAGAIATGTAIVVATVVYGVAIIAG